jgi:hypothetical protein
MVIYISTINVKKIDNSRFETIIMTAAFLSLLFPFFLLYIAK